MAHTLLVFGDSNSHGSPPIVTPGEYLRFDSAIRWPRVMARALGEGWAMVEEGLPGRTTQFDDPIMGAHMNGRTGLRIALESHGPIDLLALMLGTNDAKTRFNPTPDRIVAGIAGLVDIALSEPMQTRHDGFEVLVICPPPVEEVGPISGEFLGGAAVSEGVAPVLAAHCAARGVAFFDAGSVIEVSGQDGVHFEPDAHQALGLAVARVIEGM
ncbi:MAG TPA: lipolytic enzyme, G-D-S-L [Rhodobacteraceae bacterium]|nr:lipolytic enzyme, G-D-S-L [Paracoccaceae bacterium]